MKKIYKVGIIGVGSIVELSHLPVLKNIDDIEISWQYDKSFTRSTLVSKMFQVSALRENDLENAIQEIDICLLTIPYGTRQTFIEKCADYNKSIYVEKPFAIKVEEHEYYCKLFPSYSVAIGLQRRYYKIVSFLQHIIKGKFFGRLKQIYFTEGYFILKGGNKFTTGANLSGGRVILESAIHSLDQLLLITSANNVAVKDVKSIHKSLIDYDSLFNSVLTTTDGEVPITCEISSIRNLSNGLELHFENAILKCQLTVDPMVRIFSNDNEVVLNISDLEKYAGAETISHSYYLCWKEFINALNNQESNLTSCNSSVLTTSWIHQIYNKMEINEDRNNRGE